jgi:hypothetical protein
MGEAIGHGPAQIRREVGAVHRLQKETPEIERFEAGRVGVVLREDEFQLVAGALDERRAALRADADPVDAGRRGQRAVGFDGDLQPARVQSLDQRRVEL